jgi:ubiquinone/menaquinone biosynthesis C-methylase UbiE
MSSSRYVPAAGRAWLTRFYDPMVAVTMRESRWRPLVAALAVEDFSGGENVVEVGAGTGAQSLAIADTYEYARVIAVDGDPAVLAIARRKIDATLVDWRIGLADDLPVETGAADTAVMTLLLHHLDADGKRAALSEVRRVLLPGGRLVVADWGRPSGPAGAAGARTLQIFDGAAGIVDHLAGRLPDFFVEAGFEPPQVRLRMPTIWGTLEVLTATRRQ